MPARSGSAGGAGAGGRVERFVVSDPASGSRLGAWRLGSAELYRGAMGALSLHRHDQPDFSSRVQALRHLLRKGELQAHSASSTGAVAEVVRQIIGEVQTGGDSAAARLSSELDRANLQPHRLRIDASVLDAAWKQADAGFLALVRQVVANLREYQSHILWRAPEPLVRGGRRLGVRYTPLDRVAVYVPGGRALYPSTVLMTVVPAQVAGVREIVMVSPPTGGTIHPLALALAKELGIKEVYGLGGAVGVAAVALGTESIAPVDKVVGPGNAYVAEAKRQLFGKVGIDSIAGPSEVFIVADGSAPPAWVAADMIAQAEHDPGSAVLATPDAGLAAAVLQEVERQLALLERGQAARASLERYGAVFVTASLAQACDLANEFATEHLQVMTTDNAACLRSIRHAGAIFVGAHTPVPFGDYFAGPSHVLPTGGTARFSSPLSSNDFLKASSILEYSSEAWAEDRLQVERFAEFEGLTAHASAVRQRQA